MDQHEIARRASGLPNRFASRLPASSLAALQLMNNGGEYGELVIELTATLVKTGAEVSPAEHRELRTLLEATGMPTHPADQLSVHLPTAEN